MRSLRGGGKEKAPPYPESTRGDGHRGSTLIYHSRRPTDAGPDGGIVPRAPGRTSRPSPQTRFQPMAGPLCPGRGTVTLSDPHARHRPQPIHSSILAGNPSGVKGIGTAQRPLPLPRDQILNIHSVIHLLPRKTPGFSVISHKWSLEFLCIHWYSPTNHKYLCKN